MADGRCMMGGWFYKKDDCGKVIVNATKLKIVNQ